MDLPKNLDNAFNRLFIVPLETWQEELDSTDIIATQDFGSYVIHYGRHRDDGDPRQFIQVPAVDLNIVNCPYLDLIP